MSTATTAAIPTPGHSPSRTAFNHHTPPPTETLDYSANPRNRLVVDATGPVTEPGAPAGDMPGAAPAPGKPARRRKILAGVALVVAAAASGVCYQVFSAPYESTDDAFIAANVTPVAPQVAGRVARLLVTDNQPVTRGQVLLEIDPRDFQAKLDQARAGLAAAGSRLLQARAQLTVDQARIGEERANVAAATAEADNAAADSRRFQAVGNLGVSDSQLDLAATQARSSAAGLVAANNRLLAAQALVQLDRANIKTANAEVEGDEAAVRRAGLDLSYTRVTAPAAGVVTHRTVEAGAYVQAGQDLLAIVPRRVWVVANFKETQLTHMHPGQPVEVTVDAYPQLKLEGRVDSIQAGSGASFSLLPPENATGNFVKVVQRIPVKIVLDHVPGAPFVLGPGMSVVPEVRVR